MQYTVKYKIQPVRKNVVLAEPQKSNVRETQLKETFDNSRISLRVCERCGVVRILGERAATKYPLGCYEFKGQMLSLKFKCESLFHKKCESENDLQEISIENVEIGNRYIVYSQHNSSLFGFIIRVCQMKYNYAQVELLKPFGCKTYFVFNWPQNENWLHCTSKYDINFGSLSKVGR